MKKNLTQRIYWVLLFIAGMILIQSCDHCDDATGERTIIKFKAGQDMSNQYFTEGVPLEYKTRKRIPLHGGYYLGYADDTFIRFRCNVYYYSFTFEDLDNGNVPEDWKQHWEEYVVADTSCIEDIFLIRFDHCKKQRYQPAYCDGCNYYLDTAILNQMIDDSTLWSHPGKWLKKNGERL